MDADELDWNRTLREQWEVHWKHQLRARLEGLTDDEYFWSPVPDAWSVRPRGSSTAPVQVGGGDFTIDFAFPQPVPAAFTTIAWRLGHLIVGVLAARNDGHLHQYAARSIAPLAVHAPGAVLPTIVDALGLSGARVAVALTAALRGAFPSPVRPVSVPFIDLSECHQEILRFVAEHGPWGEYGTPIEHCLRELGLPHSQPALCAYAQTPTGTPLWSCP